MRKSVQQLLPWPTISLGSSRFCIFLVMPVDGDAGQREGCHGLDALGCGVDQELFQVRHLFPLDPRWRLGRSPVAGCWLGVFVALGAGAPVSNFGRGVRLPGRTVCRSRRVSFGGLAWLAWLAWLFGTAVSALAQQLCVTAIRWSVDHGTAVVVEGDAVLRVKFIAAGLA